METIDTVQVTISNEELAAINSALVNRYGMDFSDYEPTSLKRRIVRIMYKFGLNNILDLWRKLLYDQSFAQLFKDEISVGMTEMFRNPSIWKCLKDNYLLRFQDKKELNIWHAGCSTGEEYYSMSIVLHETNLKDIANVLVTDLSDKFVDITKKGVYDLELLSKYELNYKLYNQNGSLENYYTKTGKFGQFKKSILPSTNFIQHNLVTCSINQKFDIIFCRNVMIYFNDNLKLNVLDMFYNALNNDGLLIIGYFDGMPAGYDKYFDYYDAGLKFFIKKHMKYD